MTFRLRPDFSRKDVLIPYILLGLFVLGGGSFYFTTAYWIKFKPVCAPINERNKGTLFEWFMGYRFLEGRIRRELWYPAKIKLHWFRTSDDELDLYVPIEYYLDADIHWNYTIRAIRYFIYGELKVDSDLNRKLNPEFYDKEGRFRYSEFEKLNENYGYVSWFEFNTSRCDMIEFFFITGAQPPTDLTFAFEEEPLWKFDETEPITPYNYPIKRNKNKEIFQYFVEKFNR